MPPPQAIGRRDAEYAIARHCSAAMTFCRCWNPALATLPAGALRCAMPMAMSSWQKADAAQIAHVQRAVRTGLTALPQPQRPGALAPGPRLMATASHSIRAWLAHWWRLRTHAERAAVVAGAALALRRSLASGLAGPSRYRQTDARAGGATRRAGAGACQADAIGGLERRRLRLREPRCARYGTGAVRHQGQRDRLTGDDLRVTIDEFRSTP